MRHQALHVLNNALGGWISLTSWPRVDSDQSEAWKLVSHRLVTELNNSMCKCRLVEWVEIVIIISVEIWLKFFQFCAKI